MIFLYGVIMNNLELFIEYFRGTWENIRQASKYSSRFSRVVAKHKLLVKDQIKFFYIEQSYKYKEHNPYRKSVMKPVDNGDSLLLYSYDLETDNFSLDELEHINVTDIIDCKRINDYTFEGSTGKEKIVTKSNRSYLFSSRIILSRNDYVVDDRGYDLNNNERIIGSDFGPFKFQKTNK